MSDDLRAIAGGMICLAESIKEIIDAAGDDEDTTLLVDSRNWLLDRSTVFAPPGESQDGYPKEGAKVFNIESERAKRRNG